LAEPLAQLLSDQAADDVSGTTWREGNDQSDWLGGIGICERAARNEGRDGEHRP